MMAGEAPRPDVRWWDLAACAGEDTRLFVHERKYDRNRNGGYTDPQWVKIRTAKAMCARCPVVAECLADATDHDQSIRGGLLPEERNPRRQAWNHGMRGGSRG